MTEEEAAAERRARNYALICVRTLAMHLNSFYPGIGQDRIGEMICEIAKEECDAGREKGGCAVA